MLSKTRGVSLLQIGVNFTEEQVVSMKECCGGAGSVSGKTKSCMQIVLFNPESLVLDSGFSAGTQGRGKAIHGC